jgi:hypothetical protein
MELIHTIKIGEGQERNLITNCFKFIIDNRYSYNLILDTILIISFFHFISDLHNI